MRSEELENSSSGDRSYSQHDLRVDTSTSGSQLQCPVDGCYAIYVRRPRLVDHILTQHPEEASHLRL